MKMTEKEKNYNMLNSYNYISAMIMNYNYIKDFNSEQIKDHFQGMFLMIHDEKNARDILDLISFCLAMGIPFEKMEKTIKFANEYCQKNFKFNVVF